MVEVSQKLWAHGEESPGGSGRDIPTATSSLWAHGEESPGGSGRDIPTATSSLWVVGEAFRGSTRHPEIVCLTELLDAIMRGEYDRDDKVRFKPGQGVSTLDWAGLANALRSRGLAAMLDPPPGQPVHRSLVYKHNQHNVVITHPQREDRHMFTADLVVPDHTEMITDHTAEEQHLPGMLLIEAAIQIVTAVVVEHHPNRPARSARYAVMHGCRFEFHRFAFPLPVRLTLKLEQTGEAADDRVPLHAEVAIEQAGRLAAVARFDLHAFDPPAIYAIEHDQARKVVSHYSDGID